MLTPSKQTSGRKTKNSAQAHLIYTTNDILELLDIAPNTLTAWKKLGLSCVRSTSDLYLGQDISLFLKWNKQQRRVPLKKTEVYCVHCKQKHSLHDHQHRVIHNEAGSHDLALTCPNTGKEAHRFVSPSEQRFIERKFNRKSRTDQEDYNVDQVGSKIAIPSPLHSMINNSGNLILRYKYQLYLKQVEGFSTKTIIAIFRHIAQFDEYLQHVDYKTVLRDQVIVYKTKLENKLVTSEREQRSASTIVHSLINLKKFFQWIETKTTVKLTCSGLGDYFSPSRELSALASVPARRHPIPTLEQMRLFITAMPDSSFIERRNRSIIALLMITGLRIDALLSLQIQHIDIEKRSIFQDARIVKTKNRKTMWTKWFPVNDNCEAIVTNWVNEVIGKGAKQTDPLFPRALDPIRRLYEPDYIAPLMDQGTVRSIIKQHCALVGLPYFNPHSLRKTITLAGDEFCKNSKQRKAWSQNLGHEHISTTDQYYGKLDIDEQLSVMDNIRDHSQSKQAIELQDLISRLPQEQIDLITNLAKQCVGKGEKV